MPQFCRGYLNFLDLAEGAVKIECLAFYSNKSQGDVWLYVNQIRFVPLHW